ncbi:SHOCT domain-containing protein [Pelotomaculum terephthalicicum JT]|nr:SHOCT domain-containing protein [Pelotomaculum terephthalicicum]MCG9968612.1 SHOCT domain-containing protein [Pelotomaculum terephthalicicum JT]
MPENTSTSLTNDVIDQLERLAKLKEQGILTEEKFKEQKQKILNK